MEVIDRRANLFELEEIFKYKGLIKRGDRDVIKKIIYKNSEQSNALYSEFIRLVEMEVDHQLNKAGFYELKDQLIIKMQQLIEE